MNMGFGLSKPNRTTAVLVHKKELRGRSEVCQRGSESVNLADLEVGVEPRCDVGDLERSQTN